MAEARSCRVGAPMGYGTPAMSVGCRHLVRVRWRARGSTPRRRMTGIQGFLFFGRARFAELELAEILVPARPPQALPELQSRRRIRDPSQLFPFSRSRIKVSEIQGIAALPAEYNIAGERRREFNGVGVRPPAGASL
ncbi:hypothetical protein B0H17DRAFT_1146411 [Mycena rosella]|uniref:Uncharacterized protein n=1 Tax=Mycena rosella TaxID=1033263 RepID=A0AAD7CP15_MYCRO|nr:hypothetical protein B0H17DRAFT_1146411 [Mycena rosella]